MKTNKKILALLSGDEKWDVTAYMKNVYDEVYGTYGFQLFLGIECNVQLFLIQ